MLRARSQDEVNFRALRGSVISLEAKISAGKSTLGRSLERFLTSNGFQAKFFEEPVTNPLLELYLSDMKRYAFTFQLLIIERRIRIHQQATEFANTGGIAIIDRGIYGDMAFAYMQRKAGFFSDKEWSTYNSEIATKDLIDPHVVIYLCCSTETALRRVGIRGNQSEISAYTPKYMDALEEAHQESLKHFDGFLLKLDWEYDQPVYEQHLTSEACRKVLREIMALTT